MKKIINDPNTLVREMCYGLLATNPTLDFDSKFKIIKRRNINTDKVTLISGGGSGHEPAHAGFVGAGLLDAAVCGDVFASPSQVQVYNALKQVKSSKGTLMVIKNYSGDMMNFKNAAVMAAEEGISADYVKVDDDIAVNDSLYTVGRRGVAGTIFVHKIAGAAAEDGKSLAEVKALAQKVIDNTRSIGFALTSCTVPAKGTPTFDISQDDMEYGVGIHGEPGVSREKIQTSDKLADRMVSALVKALALRKGEKIALLVNGFGGTPLQELYVLNNSVIKTIDSAVGVEIHRNFVGNYMTSIDMAGASVSILRLDDEMKNYLDAPCESSALIINGEMHPRVRVYSDDEKLESISYADLTNKEWSRIKGNKFTTENIMRMVDHMATFIIENEVVFCELDSHAGDGDFGESIAKGFRCVKQEWSRLKAINCGIGEFLKETAMVLMENCGGASGPIWGSAFRAAGVCASGKSSVNAAEFADMLHSAVKGIQTTGERSFGRGAVVGDKTLIDALIPCADKWSDRETDEIIPTLYAGAQAARDGADKTKNIVAKMGRAGTVGERSLGYPDAGAYALGEIFAEIAKDFGAE